MPTLFDPVQAGDLHLANRIVMAPLTRNRSPHAIPRDITATYYSQRASAGLLITEATAISLTESFAMLPTAAASGYYFWRPEAHYFGAGQLGRDQVADYARRKAMPIEVVERWLSPSLGYQR